MIRAQDVQQEMGLQARATQPRPRWHTWRAVLLGLLLIPLAAYWAEDQAVDVILSLMVPPVGIVLVLVALNAGIRKLRPRAALDQSELIIIYGMLAAGTAIAAEWVGNINPLISSFALYASPTNKFDTLILPYVPSWLYIKDKSQLTGYSAGGHSFHYFLIHLHVWMAPVLAWSGLVTTMGFMFLCVNSLMRREWTDREKLAFPIIQLPNAICAGGGQGPFWRNPYVWGGALGVGLIDLINGARFFMPNVPQINVRFLGDLSQAFPGPPWNAIGWTPIAIFPFITALGVFLPSDLLFSAIFFFFFRKAQQVVAAMMGFSQGTFGGGWLVPSPPYFSEQSWGAFLGLFIMAVWIARGYLKEVWQEIVTGQSPEGRGLASPRFAFGGLLASTALLGGFGYASGVSVPFIVFYFLLFLAFSIAVTRMRAELGPPTHEMAFMGPNQLVVDAAGTQTLSPRLITVISTDFYFLNRIHRTDPMPSQLEAMKMGERASLSQSALFVALILAVLMGSLSGHLVRIYHGYRWGGDSGGWDVAQVVDDLRSNPRHPNMVALLFVVAGMATVFILNTLRFRLAWFPFNPVGYALGMNFGVDYYWMGLLIALIVKTLVQRYSGLPGYRKLHHLALGVMLGEYAMETFWSLVAMLWHIPTYTISINGRLGWQQ